MKLIIRRHCLDIVPEDQGYPNYDCRDTAFIEEVLGLRKSGDYVNLVRKNAAGLSCMGYLTTEKNVAKYDPTELINAATNFIKQCDKIDTIPISNEDYTNAYSRLLKAIENIIKNERI